MSFDKIIIQNYIKKEKFKIIDFFDKSIITNDFNEKFINIFSIINNNLKMYQNDNTFDDKYYMAYGALVGILHNLNITKIKTYNDLKKMFLLLFLTHNYNIIFDIFSISALKFFTNKNNYRDFFIDLSLDKK